LLVEKKTGALIQSVIHRSSSWSDCSDWNRYCASSCPYLPQM